MSGQWQIKNLAALLHDIRSAKYASEEAAKKSDFPYVASRGTFLATCAKNGDQCNPYPEAEACAWGGKLNEIQAAVNRIVESHPDVYEVYICGGYDGADSYEDYKAGNYEPWLENWRVPVWRREETPARAT